MDLVCALGGADHAMGGEGMDAVLGGAGEDSITGNMGNDLVFGGPGADSVSGGAGSDLVFGNDGDDLVDGGFHHGHQTDDIDRCFGGNGSDDFYNCERVDGRAQDTGHGSNPSVVESERGIKLGEGLRRRLLSCAFRGSSDFTRSDVPIFAGFAALTMFRIARRRKRHVRARRP